ncbi:Diaminopimelate epimerase [Candidatus Magnetaquicoccaceae bacterium FCR-1]|uniref:Diaminopimelate epimerase n=1 Tax=Candidatus Magnetaquiglobus chichijimensis TaxID=3141448 RepID=A0ABQ0C4U2_9PROT
MLLPFIKCHGSGNDFLLIDEMTTPLEVSETTRSRLVAALCRRNGGIGADGVLFHQPAHGADARMRIFNADGSEARMCGNGIRCLGRFTLELTGRDTVTVAVMQGVLRIRRMPDFFPGVTACETEIGPISLHPTTLPMVWDGPQVVGEILPSLSTHLRFTALSAPNPHISAPVETVDRDDLIRVGRLANGAHPLFPDGVNVSLRRVTGEESLFVATYERGVGWTHSCGTAMTASTFAACLDGAFPFGRPIRVFNAGGQVICTALRATEGENHAGLLAGNATFEWDGKVEIDPTDENNPLRHVRRVRDRDDEIRAYERFKAACDAG